MATTSNTPEVVAKARKCYGFFPITFTTYSIEKDKNGDYVFIARIGLFSSNTEKIKLRQIQDLSYNRSFINWIHGVGNITIHSSDRSASIFKILRIKHAKDFLEQLEELTNQERKNANIVIHEVDTF